MMNDIKTQKPCRLCLLRDINPAEYEAKVKRLIKLLGPDEKTPDDVYEARLQVCTTCSYLKDAFCGACGCMVELRAAKKAEKCPYGKW
ncbi:MAG: DUF6171 family protein [Lachnospiraceae bacterium]|nr:DUF6171 family protein [Lachnospiraceae bacterium]